MTITLEVPSHLEGPLRERMARDGDAEVQRLLDAAFTCALQTMLAPTPPPLSDAEFEALADQLTDEWEADGGPKDMVPADDIISREDIYGDQMVSNEVEQVLSNWIRQATSQPGQLAEGLDPAKWIAHRFLKWWRTDSVEQPLAEAGLAAQRIRSELERLGGWSNPQLGEAMHELIHLSDAIAELRAALGSTEEPPTPATPPS